MWPKNIDNLWLYQDNWGLKIEIRRHFQLNKPWLWKRPDCDTWNLLWLFQHLLRVFFSCVKQQMVSAMFSNSKQSAVPVRRYNLIPSTPVSRSAFCPFHAIPGWRRRSQITAAALRPPHLLYVILPQWETREQNMKGSREDGRREWNEAQTARRAV